jgi:hypothetical protein
MSSSPDGSSQEGITGGDGGEGGLGGDGGGTGGGLQAKTLIGKLQMKPRVVVPQASAVQPLLLSALPAADSNSVWLAMSVALSNLPRYLSYAREL